MFSRWNLSRNPFDTNPISLGTLDWFVGRRSELVLCQRLVTEGAVVVVEGQLGVGTTSFGNVVRFHAPPRTPKMELGVYSGWQSQTLLENVLVAVLHEVLDDPKARRASVTRLLRPLVERVEQSVHSAGVSLLGVGGQVTRNVAVTQPGIVPMETLRQGLVSLAEAFRPPGGGAAFTIQLNNLDPGVTFTDDELVSFLNDVRDSLQLPGFSWLLVGKKGLSRFVTQNVLRVRSIVAHDVTLEPLSRRDVKDAVRKRIAACALPKRKPKNPIEAGLLDDVYDAAGGSLREIFMICEKLCLAVASDPVYEEIRREDAGAIVAELLAVRFGAIRRSPLQKAMLKELQEKPGLTQRQLVERLGKAQTGVSRAARALMDADLVRQTKEGRQVHYWPAPEVSLAAKQIW